ncbi:hypothetical protein F5I97DRAFT_1832080 [Phlebopus sp. FC_14]|nr:hypothetical protein F5I97DRAFT_1832080 [Phlebopus sp. FC_14]
MPYQPTIFTCTPQEHLKQQWRNCPDLPVEPPPGHVRVYLFPDWDEGWDYEELIEDWLFLQGDFPLEPSGELSLTRVNKAWGLEKCMAIDPNRRKMYVGSNPDHLSPLAVRVLTGEDGILKLFEPETSEATYIIREERLKVVRQCDAAMKWFKDRVDDAVDASYRALTSIWMVKSYMFLPWRLLLMVQQKILVFILFLVLTTTVIPVMMEVVYYLHHPEKLVMLPRAW